MTASHRRLPTDPAGLDRHISTVLAGSDLRRAELAAIAAGTAEPVPAAGLPAEAVTALRAGWNTNELVE